MKVKNCAITKNDAIEQVERLLELLNFGTDPIRELEDLRDALESDDDQSIEDAINDSLDGCDTGSSRLMEIGFVAEKLVMMLRHLEY